MLDGDEVPFDDLDLHANALGTALPSLFDDQIEMAAVTMGEGVAEIRDGRIAFVLSCQGIVEVPRRELEDPLRILSVIPFFVSRNAMMKFDEADVDFDTEEIEASRPQVFENEVQESGFGDGAPHMPDRF